MIDETVCAICNFLMTDRDGLIDLFMDGLKTGDYHLYRFISENIKGADNLIKFYQFADNMTDTPI